VHVVERFAGFAESYRRQPVAPQVLHQAKRVVIDWYAALFPGSVVPPATLLERALAEEIGRGASRLADGRLAGVRAAALINGAAAASRSTTSIATASTTRERRPSPRRSRWRSREAPRARASCGR
jgi:hypothetical protein